MVTAARVAVVGVLAAVAVSLATGAASSNEANELRATNDKLRAELVRRNRAHKHLSGRLRAQVQAARVNARRWRVAAQKAPNVTAAIALASHVYGVSERDLRSTAFCESRFVPRATNGQYLGLFQLGADFRGRQTPWFPRLSPFDPYANALAAARVMAREGFSQWECSPRGAFRP